MSVLKADRKESKIEAVIYAEKIRCALLKLMKDDFGIDAVHTAVRPQYSANGETRNADWCFSLMRSIKIKIDQEATLLSDDVRRALSHYPTNMEEYQTRRRYQNQAIARCVCMRKDLEHVAEVFCVNLNRFRESTDALNREIELIKKWRQRDTRFKKTMRGSL